MASLVAAWWLCPGLLHVMWLNCMLGSMYIGCNLGKHGHTSHGWRIMENSVNMDTLIMCHVMNLIHMDWWQEHMSVHQHLQLMMLIWQSYKHACNVPKPSKILPLTWVWIKDTVTLHIHLLGFEQFSFAAMASHVVGAMSKAAPAAPAEPAAPAAFPAAPPAAPPAAAAADGSAAPPEPEGEPPKKMAKVSDGGPQDSSFMLFKQNLETKLSLPSVCPSGNLAGHGTLVLTAVDSKEPPFGLEKYLGVYHYVTKHQGRSCWKAQEAGGLEDHSPLETAFIWWCDKHDMFILSEKVLITPDGTGSHEEWDACHVIAAFSQDLQVCWFPWYAKEQHPGVKIMTWFHFSQERLIDLKSQLLQLESAQSASAHVPAEPVTEPEPAPMASSVLPPPPPPTAAPEGEGEGHRSNLPAPPLPPPLEVEGFGAVNRPPPPQYSVWWWIMDHVHVFICSSSMHDQTVYVHSNVVANPIWVQVQCGYNSKLLSIIFICLTLACMCEPWRSSWLRAADFNLDFVSQTKSSVAVIPFWVYHVHRQWHSIYESWLEF